MLPGRGLFIEIAIVVIVLAIVAWWMLPGVYGADSMQRPIKMPNIAMAENLAC